MASLEVTIPSYGSFYSFAAVAETDSGLAATNAAKAETAD
jgi:hypothetical protein